MNYLLVTPFCSNTALKNSAFTNFKSNLWFITTSHLTNMKMLEKKSLKHYLQIKRSFPLKISREKNTSTKNTRMLSGKEYYFLHYVKAE